MQEQATSSAIKTSLVEKALADQAVKAGSDVGTLVSKFVGKRDVKCLPNLSLIHSLIHAVDFSCTTRCVPPSFSLAKEIS